MFIKHNYPMRDFINRSKEIELLNRLKAKAGLVVVYGRRRVGKSRLLRDWLKQSGGCYSQSIEGSTNLQIEQLYKDLAGSLSTKIVPKSWEELFQLIEHENAPLSICIDEFPYLVASDPTLASRLQRWIDSSTKRNLLLILAGSSRRMMFDLFLDDNAPLYGRAHRIIQLEPMSYQNFCEALKLDSTVLDSFLKFSLVGGIPKYWELINPHDDVLAMAQDLYFDFAPFMQGEPRRILRDEKLDDINPASVLEIVGRGAERPSEIAARLQTKHQNLSRVLQHLMQANLLSREIPFGSNIKDAKRTVYKIADPAMRFWYRVYSPHQSLWSSYTKQHKQQLIYDNASSLFEENVRARFPGAGRYWESNLEIDIVAPTTSGKKELLVGEVKFTELSAAKRQSLLQELEQKWRATKLASKFKVSEYRVFDVGELGG